MSPSRTAHVAILAAAALVFVCARAHRSLPDIGGVEAFQPALPTVVLDRHGRTLGELYAERRKLVDIARLPEHVVQAFLASEDARFFDHAGVDPGALARAAWVNLRAGGEVRQGGSTITQQLAKTLFLAPERTVVRKLQDMALAFLIEERLPKPRILELYLNQIYFGAGAYGVGAAAQVYFGKDAAELTISEAALLAGLPRAPSAYSPIANPEAAETRRRWVLERMRELGFLDETLWRGAVAQRPRVRLAGPSEVEASAAWVVEQVRQALMQRYGAERVLRGGLRVHTTLDRELQLEATRALRAGVEELDRRRRGKRAVPGAPAVEGALVSLEVASGDLLAVVGGYDFARSNFDRAIQARRQPGSAFKPFVYGAALEAGFEPYTTVYDYQVEFPLPVSNQPWRPRNYKDELYGPIRLDEAFARSLNNATVRLLDDVGVKPVVDFARRAGIVSPLAADLGLALGTSEVTLLELTRAYASFAAGGVPPRPRCVTRVEDRDGRALDGELHVLELPDAPGISPVDAYLVTYLLRTAVHHPEGTGRSAAHVSPAIAGKTGSTNDSRDAWFVGFSPEIATGVWVGNDGGASLGRIETGARAALPIWSRYMRAALRAHKPGRFPVPKGVSFAEAEAGGGVPIAAGREPRFSTYVPAPESELPELAAEQEPGPLPTDVVIIPLGKSVVIPLGQPFVPPPVGAGPPEP
jgi:penicillin-binding protein 1A